MHPPHVEDTIARVLPAYELSYRIKLSGVVNHMFFLALWLLVCDHLSTSTPYPTQHVSWSLVAFKDVLNQNTMGTSRTGSLGTHEVAFRTVSSTWPVLAVLGHVSGI